MNRLNAAPFTTTASLNVETTNKQTDANQGLLTLESTLATPSFAEALRQQTQANQSSKNTQASVVKPQEGPRSVPPKNNVVQSNSVQNTDKVTASLNKITPSAERAATQPPSANNAATGSVKTPEANLEDSEAKSAVDDAEALAQPEHKKKQAKAAELDPLPDTALSPWMLTMMAMRPSATDARATAQAALTAGLATDNTTAVLPEAMQETLGVELAQTEMSNKVNGVGVGLKDSLALARETPVDEKDFLNTVQDFLQANAELRQEANAGAQATQLPIKIVADPRQPAVNPDKLFTNTLDQGTNSAAEQGLSTMQALANAPANQAQATSPLLTSQIAVPFGNERWQAAMNQHVMRMVSVGDEVASLTLSPPDLGPIQVVLNVDNQSVNTSFVTDNPVVRQALEDGMHDLRERMASQGLSLGNTFIGNGQQAEQHFLAQTPASRDADDASAVEANTVATIKTPTARVHQGLVDIQV